MAYKSFLKFLGMRQNSKPELFTFKLDVSAQSDGTNAGLLEGANYATVTKNGTGDYTFTLNRVARRAICVVGGSVEAEAFIREGAAADTSTFRIVVEADDGTNTDADFTVTVLALYGAIQH
jgi:hypothetical protein